MLLKRGRFYDMRRKVPKRFSEVEPRKVVTLSLKTDSETEARRREQLAWTNLLAGWETALAGDRLTGQKLLDKARHDAQRLGIVYRTAPEVAELPTRELLDRLHMAAPDADSARVDPDVATAAMGLAPVPVMTISVALERYFELMKPELRDKSEDQIRKWRNPRKKAVRRLIEVLGDIDIAALDHTAALEFRQSLLGWASDEEKSQDTARKIQTDAMTILRTVNRLDGLGLQLKFDGLTIPKSKYPPRRVPILADWLRDRILPAAAPGGALYGLNDEARRIFLMLVNTGARPSEVAGLKVKHVTLDPGDEMITVRPDGRSLKTPTSSRDIPLDGISLDAALQAVQAARDRGAGADDWVFPRYAENDTLSAVVNKFLRAHDLVPEVEGKTASAYGLRHGFRDRLDAAGMQERVCQDLMGHALASPRYGDGGGDAVRRKAVQAIAL